MYKVLEKFKNSETGEEYEVNQEIELTRARAIEIAGKLGIGFIEYVEDDLNSTDETDQENEFPKHLGAGNYELSNGDKVRGKEAAKVAENELLEIESQ
ncbi:hypothetical protein AB6883_07650 [Carnobacterium maltaromaticum]|uniref:hypothetical protein n=1 Tax=Carnobacterium maltaromaticum TaxID=2751 RepID=UPI0010739C40|nr:hypothetical protein [Carnobacterium maltaromaticum]MDT1944337.1 hypothetical protein [Carnobacterium maltaromaticum]MDT1997941.1 hypothetical protein [Carnobacterium maltaromaticum]TFJ56880.1 hypothetical protein CKN96_10530 [Carnobacterium maltaromaticum]